MLLLAYTHHRSPVRVEQWCLEFHSVSGAPWSIVWSGSKGRRLLGTIPLRQTAEQEGNLQLGFNDMSYLLASLSQVSSTSGAVSLFKAVVLSTRYRGLWSRHVASNTHNNPRRIQFSFTHKVGY